MTEAEIAAHLLDLERAAMDRWGNGDPSGFLEISDPTVVYFDQFQERRVDGLEALTALYESFRGQVKIDRYEFLNPLVQVFADAAVLTFNFVSYTGDSTAKWNCTEVYALRPAGWRIVQTHWSFIKPLGW